MKPFLDSTEHIEDGAELSLRMKRDGYLFIRDLLPADVLEELRLRFLEVARDSGWVKENTPLADAMANLESFCVEPDRDRGAPCGAPLPHHHSYGSVSGGSNFAKASSDKSADPKQD